MKKDKLTHLETAEIIKKNLIDPLVTLLRSYQNKKFVGAPIKKNEFQEKKKNIETALRQVGNLLMQCNILEIRQVGESVPRRIIGTNTSNPAKLPKPAQALSCGDTDRSEDRFKKLKKSLSSKNKNALLIMNKVIEHHCSGIPLTDISNEYDLLFSNYNYKSTSKSTIEKQNEIKKMVMKLVKSDHLIYDAHSHLYFPNEDYRHKRSRCVTM